MEEKSETVESMARAGEEEREETFRLAWVHAEGVVGWQSGWMGWRPELELESGPPLSTSATASIVAHPASQADVSHPKHREGHWRGGFGEGALEQRCRARMRTRTKSTSQ